jgi:hypothetical protein
MQESTTTQTGELTMVSMHAQAKRAATQYNRLSVIWGEGAIRSRIFAENGRALANLIMEYRIQLARIR